MNMLIDENSFTSLKEFVEHISKKGNVVGIVEYGGRTCEDMRPGGDYDLTIIYDKPISKNFNGVHFHIAGIPVDCMLLSLEDFDSEVPSNEFLLVHMNCKILFDRDGTINAIIKRIKISWKAPKEISDFEKSLFRFTFRHVLDKLEHRLFDNVLYSRYFIFSSFDWFLECYARMNNLEIGKPRSYLKYIESNNIELYNLINEMYSTTDIMLQFDMLKKCAQIMISPIGELWADNEILFHLMLEGVIDKKEQEETKRMLFE